MQPCGIPPRSIYHIPVRRENAKEEEIRSPVILSPSPRSRKKFGIWLFAGWREGWEWMGILVRRPRRSALRFKAP